MQKSTNQFEDTLPLCERPDHNTMQCGVMCLSPTCVSKWKPMCVMCLYTEHYDHLELCLAIPSFAEKIGLLRKSIEPDRVKNVKRDTQDNLISDMETKWSALETEILEMTKNCLLSARQFVENLQVETHEVMSNIKNIDSILNLEPDILFDEKKYSNFMMKVTNFVKMNGQDPLIDYEGIQNFIGFEIPDRVESFLECMENWKKEIRKWSQQLEKIPGYKPKTTEQRVRFDIHSGTNPNLLAQVKDRIEQRIQDTGGDQNTLGVLGLDYIHIHKITPGVKEELEKYKNIYKLSLNNCELISLKNFPNLPALEELCISGNKLAGNELKHLTHLKNLKNLNLSQNEIQETADFAILSGLPNLGYIQVAQNGAATKEGYRKEIFDTIKSLHSIDCMGRIRFRVNPPNWMHELDM